MMKTIFTKLFRNVILVLMMFFVCCLFVACQSGGTSETTGYWYLYAIDDEGNYSQPTFLQIAQNDSTLTIEDSCDPGADPFSTGSIEGKWVSFTMDFGGEEDGNTAVFMGELSDDGYEIEGTVVQNDLERTAVLLRTLEHVCNPDDPTQVIAEYPAEVTASLSLTDTTPTTDCSDYISNSHYPTPGSTPSAGAKGDSTPSNVDGDDFPLVCVDQNYTSSTNKSLDNSVLINAETNLFPGAVFQGSGLLENPVEFDPITYKRSSNNTITLSNVTLPAGCSYSTTITSEYTQAAVNDAIGSLLTCKGGPTGTAAYFTYNAQEVYSSDHMAFQLGLDGKYSEYSASNQFSIDTTTNKNHVVLSFWQVFYTVSFPTPANPSDVFADNSTSCSDGSQMGAGNPPIYVKSADYGRVVYFLMESEFSQQDIKDTLEGAYNGLASSLKVTSGVTRQEVAGKSQVHYAVYGGSAALAVQPIAADEDSMFDAVKSYIASEKAATYSASNPGKPMRYVTEFLASNRPTILNFNVTYDIHSCAPQAASNSFKITASSINSHLYMHEGASTSNMSSVVDTGGSSTSYTFSDDDCAADPENPDCERYVSVELTNGDCFSSGVKLNMYRNGSHIWERDYSHGWSTCGEQYYARWKLNYLTGDYTEDYSKGYHGAHWDSPDWGWVKGE